MTYLDRIKNALLTVSNSVWHYEALKRKPPYIVWEEDSAGRVLFADNGMCERTISGTVHLFELAAGEGDTELRGKIEMALSADDGIAWRLNSVQTEQETGLRHVEWIWEVAGEDFF